MHQPIQLSLGPSQKSRTIILRDPQLEFELLITKGIEYADSGCSLVTNGPVSLNVQNGLWLFTSSGCRAAGSVGVFEGGKCAV